MIVLLPAIAAKTTLRKTALSKLVQICLLWSCIATCNIEKNASPDKENTTKMLHAPATLMNSEIKKYIVLTYFIFKHRFWFKIQVYFMYYRVFGSHQDIHHKLICHSRSIFGMDQSSPAREDHLMTLRNLEMEFWWWLRIWWWLVIVFYIFS